jgi:fibronectin-binding autotransporter adhesin
MVNQKLHRSTRALSLLAVSLVGSLLAPASSTPAADYTWSGGTAGGLWDTSATNWTGASGQPWDAGNGPTNTATFNVTSGSAVVNSVTTNRLTFAPTSSGTFTLTGGTIALGGGTSAQIMNVVPSGTVSTASTLTIASTITSATNFFIGGYGTTILSASNSLAGTVTIGSGSGTVLNPTVILNNSNALAGASAVSLLGGGVNSGQGQTLQLGNGVTISGVSLSTNAGTSRAALRVASGGTGTWNGNISGNGTLYADGFLTIGTGTTTTVTIGTIRGSGTGVLNSAITSLNKTDPGTWIINSNGTYTSTPSISSGNIQVATIANAGVVSPIGSGTTINVGNSSGSGFSSFGNFGLLRVVSSTGGSSDRRFTVTGGTWAGGGSGGGIDSGVAGQTLTMSGSVTASGSAASFVLTGSGNGVYSGNIAATGTTILGLYKAGSGTWTLSGSNTFTGPVYMNGGVLSLGSGNALGASGTLQFGVSASPQASTLQFGPSYTADVSSKILGSSAAIGIDTNGQSLTFASSLAVSNTGGLTKVGAGLLTLSASNAYLGTTTISGGTLAVGNAFALSSAAARLNAAGGVLDLGGFSVSRTGTISFTGGTVQNGTLTNDAVAYDGQSGAVSAVLAGNVGLTKSTAGLLTLSATNIYSGSTTVSSGTLAVGNASALGSAVAGLTAAGGVLDLGGFSVSRTGTISFTGGTVQNGTLTNGTVAYDGQSGSVSAVLAGNVGLTKSTAGLLTLSAANTYTGLTTVSAGTLALSGLGTPGTSGTVSLTGSGATYSISDISGSGISLGSVAGVANSVVALGGKTLSLGEATSGTFAGIFSGAGGGLTKVGSGTLSLTGASTYTGPTTLSAGVLSIGVNTANRLPTATALNFTGPATFALQNTQTVGSLSVADATTATLTPSAANTPVLVVSNSITLGGGSGPQTLVVTTQTSSDITLTSTPGITVNAGGDLRLGAYGYTSGTFTNPNNFKTGNVSGPVTINGGSLSLATMVTSGGQTTIGASGAVTNQVGAFTMTDGQFFMNNSINNDRRFSISGTMTVTGGTMGITATNDMALNLNGATNTLYTLNPASFDRNIGIAIYSNSSTLSAGVPLGRVFTRLSTAGSVTLTSSATGGNIGTLNINDGSASPGGTTVRLGSNLTLVAGNGALSAMPQATTYSAVLEPGGRMDFGIDTSGYTFDLSGNTGVWQPNSAGTVSGTASQAYWQLSSTSGTGRFIANGYNFVFSSGSSNAYTAVGPNVILESTSGNGVANNLGSSGTTGLVTIDPTSTFRYSGTAATATPSTLTSARSIGNLEVAGSGALRLLAISGSVGNVSVSNGRLILGGTSIPVLPSLAVTGGTFDLAGYASTITDLSGSAGGTITTSSNTSVTLTVGGANSTQFDGTIANAAGTLNLTKTGAGTLTLGGANTFTGTTTIAAGSIALANANALQTSILDTASFGSLSFGSLSSVSFGGLAGSSNIALTNSGSALNLSIGGGNASNTYGGVLSGLGGLTKVGSGTFTLTGSQTYAGTTTISQGTLQLGNGGTTGAVPGSVTNNGVLVFNRSDSLTFSQAIDGSGSVTQSGGGRLTLSGSNSYSGGTLITGTGSLAISNPASIGSGPITLQTAQTGANAVFVLANSMTLSNAINFVQVGSNRNNLETTGVTTLSGPLTISGTGFSTNIISNAGGTLTTVTGNLTAASSFTGNLSFRGNILFTGTINTPGANIDLNTGGTTTISSTGNVWTYTQFQGSNNVLKVGAENALPTNARVQFSGNASGGGLDLNGFNQSIPGFTSDSGTIPAPLARIFNNAGTNSTLTLAGLTADRSANIALADGTGGGKLALVMNSAGRTQTLASATSSYSGGTTILAGTLAQGAANALGNGPLAVNGGSLDLGGFGLTVGTLSGSAGGVIRSGTVGAVTFTAGSASNSSFAGLIENGNGTVAFTKAGSGALTLTAANTYTGLTTVSNGSLVVDGSLAGDVSIAAAGSLGGSGSVAAIGGAGLVGPGNSPGILTATSIDPTAGLSFGFEFTQADPNYATPTASGNDLLWLTGGTPFASSLSAANSVNVYFTQAALDLGTLTGGFFTTNAADFISSIDQGMFQYFVQDVAGSVTYNGLTYKTLADYDASKNVNVSTVAANGGRVMQMVVVPEPGSLALAGVGAAIAAWTLARRRRA